MNLLKSWKVKVFCSECGLIFKEDELLKWARELEKRYVPAWLTKARWHESDNRHHVMVEFPNQTLPMKLDEIYGVYY